MLLKKSSPLSSVSRSWSLRLPPLPAAAAACLKQSINRTADTIRAALPPDSPLRIVMRLASYQTKTTTAPVSRGQSIFQTQAHTRSNNSLSKIWIPCKSLTLKEHGKAGKAGGVANMLPPLQELFPLDYCCDLQENFTPAPNLFFKRRKTADPDQNHSHDAEMKSPIENDTGSC